MLNQRARETAYLEAMLDGLLLALAFASAFTIRALVPLDFLGPHRVPSFSAHFWVLSIGIPLFWILAGRSGLYDRSRCRSAADLIGAIARPFLSMSVLLGTAIFLFQAKTFSRAVFFMFLLIGFGLVAGVRLLLRMLAPWTRNRGPQRRVLLVGCGPRADSFRGKLAVHPEFSMEIIGALQIDGGDEPPDCLGHIDDLERIAGQQVVDEVVFAVRQRDWQSLEPAIAWCEEVGITAHLILDPIPTMFARTYSSQLDGTPLLSISPTPRDPAAMVLKRTLDVVGSFVALVLLLPVLLGSALLVWMTSPGPVLFAQARVGLNGRRFKLYKLRSMYQDAEARRAEVEALNEASGPVFKMRRDPRVTPVGRWLRRFSLDELPQLWNVMRGDMSLVGPRPPIPSEVVRYERWQRRRLSMKPGLTCLWQVGGRSRVGFEEWMRLDLAYIDNWSFELDLKILLRTVPAVLLARGAQ